MFIKLKAQQGSNKLSNSEKCIIPQEPYMPIFLKPSHKIRILNVNIVYLCVCMCVCVCARTNMLASFQKLSLELTIKYFYQIHELLDVNTIFEPPSVWTKMGSLLGD